VRTQPKHDDAKQQISGEPTLSQLFTQANDILKIPTKNWLGKVVPFFFLVGLCWLGEKSTGEGKWCPLNTPKTGSKLEKC
jgi:hypothetical protein